MSKPVSGFRGGDLLLGALSGLGGTIVMTAALRRLARRPAADGGYPAPPREIVERVLPDESRRSVSETRMRDLTIASHFGYGALTGALLVLFPKRPGALGGAAYGVLVWAFSYLGWIPAARILRPATGHPPERNVAMAAAHAVWGAVTAAGLRELTRARADLFMQGPVRDARPRRGRGR